MPSPVPERSAVRFGVPTPRTTIAEALDVSVLNGGQSAMFCPRATEGHTRLSQTAMARQSAEGNQASSARFSYTTPYAALVQCDLDGYRSGRMSERIA